MGERCISWLSTYDVHLYMTIHRSLIIIDCVTLKKNISLKTKISHKYWVVIVWLAIAVIIHI